MASRTAGVVTMLFVLSFALLASTNGSAPSSAAAASTMQAVDNKKMAEVGAGSWCVCTCVCASMHICMCWVLLLGIHRSCTGTPRGGT